MYHSALTASSRTHDCSRFHFQMRLSCGMSITASGFGPVLLDTGHIVVNPEGDVLAQSGVSRLDVDALCAALGSPNQ